MIVANFATPPHKKISTRTKRATEFTQSTRDPKRAKAEKGEKEEKAAVPSPPYQMRSRLKKSEDLGPPGDKDLGLSQELGEEEKELKCEEELDLLCHEQIDKAPAPPSSPSPAQIAMCSLSVVGWEMPRDLTVPDKRFKLELVMDLELGACLKLPRGCGFFGYHQGAPAPPRDRLVPFPPELQDRCVAEGGLPTREEAPYVMMAAIAMDAEAKRQARRRRDRERCPAPPVRIGGVKPRVPPQIRTYMCKGENELHSGEAQAGDGDAVFGPYTVRRVRELLPENQRHLTDLQCVLPEHMTTALNDPSFDTCVKADDRFDDWLEALGFTGNPDRRKRKEEESLWAELDQEELRSGDF